MNKKYRFYTFCFYFLFLITIDALPQLNLASYIGLQNDKHSIFGKHDTRRIVIIGTDTLLYAEIIKVSKKCLSANNVCEEECFNFTQYNLPESINLGYCGVAILDSLQVGNIRPVATIIDSCYANYKFPIDTGYQIPLVDYFMSDGDTAISSYKFMMTDEGIFREFPGWHSGLVSFKELQIKSVNKFNIVYFLNTTEAYLFWKGKLVAATWGDYDIGEINIFNTFKIDDKEGYFFSLSGKSKSIYGIITVDNEKININYKCFELNRFCHNLPQ